MHVPPGGRRGCGITEAPVLLRCRFHADLTLPPAATHRRSCTKYVQLQFFRGTSLDPVPPKASAHDEVRDLDVYEDDDLDEDQLVSWIEQASNLPGEKM